MVIAWVITTNIEYVRDIEIFSSSLFSACTAEVDVVIIMDALTGVGLKLVKTFVKSFLNSLICTKEISELAY